MSYRVESLMSARLFAVPQYAGKKVYFLSNLSGHLSLYCMDFGGSVPSPLLPPHIALQNPHLIGGLSFRVFEKQQKILMMIDKNDDENYQPMFLPIEGGIPQPADDADAALRLRGDGSPVRPALGGGKPVDALDLLFGDAPARRELDDREPVLPVAHRDPVGDGLDP